MKPLVSICVPIYNGEKYLRDCLDSILAQTFSDFEVLIVDDQSSDESVRIAKEYAEKDARIRVMRNQKNLGLVGNWNRCVELARGEWIKFVFQDDLIAPECLEKMLAASRIDTSIVCCNRDFIYDSNTPKHLKNFYDNILLLEHLFPKSTEINAKDYSTAVLNHIGYNFVGEPTVVMLRRDVFQKFGSFNPHLIQICDFEYWTRIAVHTGIVYVPETLASFRVHGNATSAKNHSGRQYRLDKLDQLILIHDFALHPIYTPLRIVATEQSKPIDLFELLRKKSFWSWRDAVKNSSSFTEWRKVTCSYPILSQIAKRNLIERYFANIMQGVNYIKQETKKIIKYQILQQTQENV